MGCVETIRHDRSPKAGPWLGLRTEVCFFYDTTHIVMGTIVRDDAEEPFRTVIKLDDGRFVLASECMHSPQSLSRGTGQDEQKHDDLNAGLAAAQPIPDVAESVTASEITHAQQILCEAIERRFQELIPHSLEHYACKLASQTLRRTIDQLMSLPPRRARDEEQVSDRDRCKCGHRRGNHPNGQCKMIAVGCECIGFELIRSVSVSAAERAEPTRRSEAQEKNSIDPLPADEVKAQILQAIEDSYRRWLDDDETELDSCDYAGLAAAQKMAELIKAQIHAYHAGCRNEFSTAWRAATDKVNTDYEEGRVDASGHAVSILETFLAAVTEEQE